MATVSQVRRWSPAAMAAAAAVIDANNRVVKQSLDSMDGHVDDALNHWEGDAAAAASARALADSLAGSHIVTAVYAETDALTEAAGALGPARTTVLDIADGATASGMTVTDDGHVSAPSVTSTVTILDLLVQKQMTRDAQTLDARLIAALHTADELDQRAAAALTRAADDLRSLVRSPAGDAVGAVVSAILDGTASIPNEPAAFNTLWESLSPSDKDALAQHDPSIGNRDGMPASDKDSINRGYLDTLQTRAASAVTAIENQHPDWAANKNVPPDVTPGSRAPIPPAMMRAREEYDQWAETRSNANHKVDAYKELAKQIDTGPPPRLLLGVDDQGHAAVAINNPDSAAHVATLVPGTGSEMGKIGGDIERSQRMLDAADKASNDAGQVQSTSVITWSGYTAPPQIVDAISDSYADAGAPRLEQFQEGLRASHDGPPSHNTLVGHSYGSTVIGAAASSGSLAVDDVFFAGSPGVGVDHASDLHLDGVDSSDMGHHTYATAAKHDPVPLSGTAPGALDFIPIIGPEIAMAVDIFGHGPDPTGDDFGATVVDVFDGSLDNAHSEYWDDDNPSLTGMGHVIAGLGAP